MRRYAGHEARGYRSATELRPRKYDASRCGSGRLGWISSKRTAGIAGPCGLGSKHTIPENRRHAKIFPARAVMMHGVLPFKLPHESKTAAEERSALFTCYHF